MRRQAILVVRMSARLVLEDIGTAIAQIARKAEERRASLAGQRALADKSVDEARESR
jgi:hypothetical protein